jgi:hypothetical protein
VVLFVFRLWCLTSLWTIFQFYRGSQFYWWRKPEYPEKTTDHKMTYAVNAYHHDSCEKEFLSARGVLDALLCDIVCMWLAASRWKSGGVNLVLWAQTFPLSEMMRSCTRFNFHVSKIPTLTYNRPQSVIIKNALILNNNIFNRRNREDVIIMYNISSIIENPWPQLSLNKR